MDDDSELSKKDKRKLNKLKKKGKLPISGKAKEAEAESKEPEATPAVAEPAGAVGGQDVPQDVPPQAEMVTEAAVSEPMSDIADDPSRGLSRKEKEKLKKRTKREQKLKETPTELTISSKEPETKPVGDEPAGAVGGHDVQTAAPVVIDASISQAMSDLDITEAPGTTESPDRDPTPSGLTRKERENLKKQAKRQRQKEETEKVAEGLQVPPESEESAPTKAAADRKPGKETIITMGSGITSSTTVQKQIDLHPPSRPNFGKEGRQIPLRANHFKVDFPDGFIQHYDVSITPVVPRRVNREIIEVLVKEYDKKIFRGLKPVYDGKANIYTKKRLPIDNERVELDVSLPDERRERRFKVKIKWAAEVSLFALEEVLNGRSRTMPLETVQALDVILRHLPSMTYTPVGRSFFMRPDNGGYDLGGGREVWFGFYTSIRPTQWKTMTLNIDVSATAFYKAQPVLDFMCEILNLRSIQDQRRPLEDRQRMTFSKEIKGLKIEVTHSGTVKRKYRVIGITRRPANTQTFPLTQKDGGSTVNCTVEKYFRNQYNKNLQYPHLQCLQVGQEEKHTYIPLEVCNIVHGQRCIKKLTDTQTAEMIKQTAKPAYEREREINKLARDAQYDQDPFLNAFGIKVSTRMVEIPGRVINAPQIQYSEQCRAPEASPREGSWTMVGHTFYKSTDINTWAIICFDQRTREDALNRFSTELMRTSKDVGMPIRQKPCFVTYARAVEDVEQICKNVQREHPTIQLVIVILPPGRSDVYAEVKKVGDVRLGIVTQCFLAKNVFKCQAATLSNLCLKINVKLGGINNILLPKTQPAIFKTPVIVFGADVTHPSPGDVTKPSIAAVVASMDRYPCRYEVSVRAQKHRQEIIEDLANMVMELLKQFYKATKQKPQKIIFYRDGVSEGQFLQVLAYELRAVRQACEKLEVGYQPGITFIVVQKRHHTRLFPVNKQDATGRSGNVPPGTTVDSAIVHPTEFDFYLCSHFGIQGTSRPAHYHVLWDDNDFKADDLQKLTYFLCHTYARCTRSVSIPAPAYYAHLVAFRARYHLAETDGDSNGSMVSSGAGEEMQRSPESMAVALKLHPNIAKVMYFA